MAQARVLGKQIEFHEPSISRCPASTGGVSQALRDDTVCKRINDAGINPDHIGQTAFVDFIRQTGIRVEQ
jgi:hypothetical protein